MSDIIDPVGDRRYGKVYKEHTPDLLAKYADFSAAVFGKEGRVIPQKYRELAAITVALTTQCAYCLDHHTKAALRAGATEAEVAEIAWVAAAVRAGGAYTHGHLAFKLGGLGNIGEAGEHQH